MNYRNIIFLLIASCIFFQIYAGEIFVLGTYDARDVDDLMWVRDSLGLNTIRSSWIGTQDSIKNYLSVASEKGLRVILGDAGINRITRLSRFYHIYNKVWESDSNYVYHSTGKKVFDRDAGNRYAWKCTIKSDPPGLMQHGPSGWQAKIQTHHIKPLYSVQFCLKIDGKMSTRTEKVCSLVVLARRDKISELIANTVLRVEDFPRADQYGLFTLDFTKERLDWDIYEFRIWWYGRVNLWSDYIEVQDEHADLLFNGVYDDSLDMIFSCYQSYPALSFFYLKDEPFYGHFKSSQYLMNHLDKNFSRTPGIQALGAGGKKFFADYVRTVSPSILLFDKYPIRDNTPESGPHFQKALDGMCEQLSDMRMVANAATLDFWFIVQAFGRYESPYPDEGGFARKWRSPTTHELRCMTWLGLAFGAKGIFYYCFRSRLEDNYYLRGLWRFDNTPCEPLFSEAKSLAVILEAIGPILLTLTSDCVFKSDSVPSDCIVNDIKSRYDVQVGTFYNDVRDPFLIIVNRHCQSLYAEEVLINLKGNYKYLEDLYTKESISADNRKYNTSLFSIILEPGEGRFLKVID